ncbi:DUF177 domain-containing protein [Bacteroidota bacterium]
MSMIIKYVNYSNGVHNIELSDTPEELNLDASITGDVLLKCKMDKSFHQIFLECEVHFTASLTCDRCNKEYSTGLVNTFSSTYIFENVETADDESSVQYISHDVDKIDLTEEVSEYTKLAIPMKKICSEECKGLCPVCGNNRNEIECDCKIEITNSVWDPLKKLKDNN